jgi:hypothetical protein
VRQEHRPRRRTINVIGLQEAREKAYRELTWPRLF